MWGFPFVRIRNYLCLAEQSISLLSSLKAKKKYFVQKESSKVIKIQLEPYYNYEIILNVLSDFNKKSKANLTLTLKTLLKIGTFRNTLMQENLVIKTFHLYILPENKCLQNWCFAKIFFLQLTNKYSSKLFTGSIRFCFETRKTSNVIRVATFISKCDYSYLALRKKPVSPTT